MDTLSHGLYGGIAFGRKSRKDYITAFLFGVMPDILAFGPVFAGSFLGLMEWPSRHIEGTDILIMPKYVYHVYNATHSLIIFGIFFGLLWLFKKKKFAMLSLAWPLHILVDIPTHTLQFFPTPVLWPFSSFAFNGIRWSNPIIFIPNVIILIVLHTIWYLKRKRAEIVIKDR